MCHASIVLVAKDIMWGGSGVDYSTNLCGSVITRVPLKQNICQGCSFEGALHGSGRLPSAKQLCHVPLSHLSPTYKGYVRHVGIHVPAWHGDYRLSQLVNTTPPASCEWRKRHFGMQRSAGQELAYAPQANARQRLSTRLQLSSRPWSLLLPRWGHRGDCGGHWKRLVG